ncbi:SIMPL domain-containing protein [Pseudoalteromonas haloplanktis]|uniref:SIMPL domain-containing protein n=1 Tax=Pseudoalteromonas haloplanktis TaxID=228 RepID=A0ABU1B8F4_PSEHA|nr:SIMPL domain-containing protein [Pseudoalteromonas haloplanktis]MDQ9090703.1 SIMPL domain-containing protein [Pseudoalteromonas haloplanktis]
MRYLPLLAAAFSFNVFAASTPDAPHIYIQGQAKITTAADNVMLDVGIVEVNKDLMAAKQQADTTMAKAIKLAKQAGVLDKDINAGQISIHRENQYNRETNKQEFVGFRVSRSLSLTLKEIDKYPQLLQNLVSGGINEINQTQFVSSRFQELKQQAQKMAIKDAKSAAEEFASDFDVKLKGLYSASMSPIETNVQPYMRAKMANMVDAESGSFVPDAYHAGELVISASSYAIYLIEDK